MVEEIKVHVGTEDIVAKSLPVVSHAKSFVRKTNTLTYFHSSIILVSIFNTNTIMMKRLLQRSELYRHNPMGVSIGQFNNSNDCRNRHRIPVVVKFHYHVLILIRG